MAWILFFIAEREVLGQDEEENDIMGYKLGPDDHEVLPNQVIELKNVGSTYLFKYITKNDSVANQVKDWPEFRGFGYTDCVMRIALGLSNGTLAEIKHMTGAHWFTGGEWHFGSAKDWEDAGSPDQVWFGHLRGILGVEVQ